MAQVLICKNCHSDLTKPIKISYGHSKQYDKNEDFLPAVNEGLGLRHKAAQWNSDNERLELKNVVWINLSDVFDIVQKDTTYIGCCGMNGGANTLCKCGTIIGSEYSDCGGALSRFQTNDENTFWMEYIAQDKKREHQRSERISSDKKAATLFPKIQRDYYV